MAEAAKYMFDRTFDVSVKGDAAATHQSEEEWERKMAEACRTAYEKGRSEGEAEALKSIEEATRAETGVLLESTQQLLGSVEQELDHIRQSAIELAAMTANLLAEELIARSPTLNLEKLFADALEHLGDAPHIALTVNDALAEDVQKSVTTIAADRGFIGKIVVLGDPETKKGDCSLLWADGGISLDFEKTSRQISSLVRRHLDRMISQSRDPGPAQEPSETPLSNDVTAPETDAEPQSQPGIEPVSETVTGPGDMK